MSRLAAGLPKAPRRLLKLESGSSLAVLLAGPVWEVADGCQGYHRTPAFLIRGLLAGLTASYVAPGTWLAVQAPES